ncbi:DMT family protein [Paracoccus sp. (in: a-proteobacteria)]|uniref:DMT family protein n=1 Tax=Paracoccus sp. TaxID=267 RepID=UPI003A849EC8
MGLSLPVPVVTIGLLIAFFEYTLQVPANRIGYGHFSAAQLKTIQEVISLSVFALFSWVYLGESLTWQHGVGFSLICLGAWFVFHDWG